MMIGRWRYLVLRSLQEFRVLPCYDITAFADMKMVFALVSASFSTSAIQYITIF